MKENWVEGKKKLTRGGRLFLLAFLLIWTFWCFFLCCKQGKTPNIAVCAVQITSGIYAAFNNINL